MARYSGKGGSITGAGANIAITSWEIDARGDAVDVTGMDSGGAKEFVSGLTEWSGTFEGFATGSLAGSAPGTSVTGAVFKSSAAAGAPKLTGNLIITGCRVQTTVEGAVRVTCTFQGTGPLTWGVTP